MPVRAVRPVDSWQSAQWLGCGGAARETAGSEVEAAQRRRRESDRQCSEQERSQCRQVLLCQCWLHLFECIVVFHCSGTVSGRHRIRMAGGVSGRQRALSERRGPDVGL